MALRRAASRAARCISAPSISAPCMPAQYRGASMSAAMMSPLSRRASAIPARVSDCCNSSRSIATVVSPTAAPRLAAASHRSSAEGRRPLPPPSPTELLLHIRQRQLLQQRIDLPLQGPRQLMQREANPVIGHAILREVVRANLGRAITRAHLRAAQPGALRFLLREALIEQARAEHFHGLELVLQLWLLVLLA